MLETWILSLDWEDPLEESMYSCLCQFWNTAISVFLPGESHGWRGLVGYCSWGHKELDMTERLNNNNNNILLNSGKLKAFPHDKDAHLPHLFNIVLEVLATAIREDKVVEGIQIGKGRIKTVTVCRRHDTIHRKS